MIASTCLLIASKFFDRKLPPLSELEKVHHGNARAHEFQDLELRILSALRWKLHVPLPHNFVNLLEALCPNAPFDATIKDRMHFFIDLSVYSACTPPLKQAPNPVHRLPTRDPSPNRHRPSRTAS